VYVGVSLTLLLISGKSPNPPKKGSRIGIIKLNRRKLKVAMMSKWRKVACRKFDRFDSEKLLRLDVCLYVNVSRKAHWRRSLIRHFDHRRTTSRSSLNESTTG